MMNKFRRGVKGQSTFEYVLILTAIILAIVFASTFIQKRVFDNTGATTSLIGSAGNVISDAAADFNYAP